MTKLRFAAILIAFSAVLLGAKGYFAKEDRLVAQYEHCVDENTNEDVVINACGEVLQVDWLSVSTRSSLLKERANAFRKLKKFDQAFADIEQVLALNPDDANAYQWRSQIYLNLEEFERAEVEYLKALSLAPTDVELINWWQRWMSGLDRQQKLLETCDQLFLAGREVSSTISCKIKPLLKLDRSDEAIRLLKYLADTGSDKDKAGAYFVLGRIYLHLGGSKQETLAVFEKWNALGIAESEPLPELFLAATYLKFDEEEKGAELIEGVADHMMQEMLEHPIGPWKNLKTLLVRGLFRDASHHHFSGIAYSMIREYELAKQEFDRFMKLGGPNARALLIEVMKESGFVPSAEAAQGDQRVFDRGLERHMTHYGRHFSFDALLD